MKTLYTFEALMRGVFKERPNRYLSRVLMDHSLEDVHVHDPGKLKELLYEDNLCYVKYVFGEKRKTKWDMIAAQKGSEYVLVHSGYHRVLAEGILNDSAINPFGKANDLRAEVKHGASRIDFTFNDEKGNRVWVEVKGCSLSEEGLAKFPDAPTTRGLKHLNSLMEIKNSGERAGILLLVFSEAKAFMPKADTDPKFAKAFYEALSLGVEIHPLMVRFDPDTGEMVYHGEIPILAEV